MAADSAAERNKAGDPPQPEPGTWSWLKEYTGYLVTVLPYVSAGLVLIPTLKLWIKVGILIVFAVLVLYIRVWHEKAGIAVTSDKERRKRVLSSRRDHLP
jgi:hypothetical protein